MLGSHQRTMRYERHDLPCVTDRDISLNCLHYRYEVMWIDTFWYVVLRIDCGYATERIKTKGTTSLCARLMLGSHFHYWRHHWIVDDERGRIVMIVTNRIKSYHILMSIVANFGMFLIVKRFTHLPRLTSSLDTTDINIWYDLIRFDALWYDNHDWPTFKAHFSIVTNRHSVNTSLSCDALYSSVGSCMKNI